MGGTSSVEGRSRNARHSCASAPFRNPSYEHKPYGSGGGTCSSREWTSYQPGHRPSSPSQSSDDSPPVAFPAAPSYYGTPRPPAADYRVASATNSRAGGGNRANVGQRFLRIADDFTSLQQVTEALAEAGLESSNLIVGVDFTKSNEWTGKSSFHGHSLHHIATSVTNPYEQAISIIGRTLSAFDEDNLIPCFGFGDASTHDRDVFSFYPGARPCNGFEDALLRYRQIAPNLQLSGPTSFAPIIEMAITIVEQSGGLYHVLVIIADGQVTRSVDTPHGRLSPQEQKTVDAIVRASQFPLSIILVGVGDGPWDIMKEFDDHIPARSFDNFQFVNFTEIMVKNASENRKETQFALAALMEIPLQYRATMDLGILGSQHQGTSPRRMALPPPSRVPAPASVESSASTKQSSSSNLDPTPAPATSVPSPTASWDSQVCPVCLSNPRNMAFGCGHQTCRDCGPLLRSCPICRSAIQTRIKLY